MFGKLFGHRCAPLLGVLVAAGVLLAIEFAIYYGNFPDRPVVCSFVKFDNTVRTNGNAKIILKCGDKEYWSTDGKLIASIGNNPQAEIKGMLYHTNEVRSE